MIFPPFLDQWPQARHFSTTFEVLPRLLPSRGHFKNCNNDLMVLLLRSSIIVISNVISFFAAYSSYNIPIILYSSTLPIWKNQLRLLWAWALPFRHWLCWPSQRDSGPDVSKVKNCEQMTTWLFPLWWETRQHQSYLWSYWCEYQICSIVTGVLLICGTEFCCGKICTLNFWITPAASAFGELGKHGPIGPDGSYMPNSHYTTLSKVCTSMRLLLP